MRKLQLAAVAMITALTVSAPAFAIAPEYKACHAGNLAVCKHWRDRSCNDDANPAACDYSEARSRKTPLNGARNAIQICLGLQDRIGVIADELAEIARTRIGSIAEARLVYNRAGSRCRRLEAGEVGMRP